MPHRIRLAGPWKVEPQEKLSFLDAGDSPSPEKRVRFPCSWQELFGNQAGTALCRRSFNAPSGIDRETVSLVFEGMQADGEIRLNQHLLTTFSTKDHRVTVDISAVMQPTNRLEVKLTCPAEIDEDCGLHRPVSLVIAAENEESA